MHSILQSLKRMMDNLSLKYKLFILLVSISIIPIALVSYSTQYFMFRSSTNYTSSISSQYVEFLSQDISNYFLDLNQSFDQLFMNAYFQKYLETPSDDLITQADYINNFRPILRTPLQFRSEILGVLYLDQVGKIYFDSFQKGLNTDYSFDADELYRSIYQMKKPELTIPHTMSYTLISQEKVFSLVRPIINMNTGLNVAWFVIEIREDKIKSLLRGTEYGQEGFLFLYHDTKGEAVSNVNMDPALVQDFKRTIDLEPNLQNEFIFNSNNIQYEATYANLPYGDWKLVWMAPLSSITKGAQQAYQLTLLIAVVSLVVALIIAFPVMRFVLLPLYKLKDGIKSLGQGAYVPIQIQHGNDEIGFLIKSYNHTLHELQSMEEEVFNSKIREKERELLQLQAQINPHFLFNTLETIESYSIKNNGEAVGDMVQSVSRMMRYNVRNDGGWAPLKEEMDYIQNFLKIHYYRNGMDVSAKFDVDASSLNIPVMKLSIQPFVENAIKYGWSPNMSTEEFCVTVKVELMEEILYISIRDTGSGIPSEVMEKFNTLITFKGELIDAYFQLHTGIYNVYRRFMLAYGDQTDFKISTVSGLGTLIEIRVPYRKNKAV
jgi:two-component system sensor histidine kinase YesM